MRSPFLALLLIASLAHAEVPQIELTPVAAADSTRGYGWLVPGYVASGLGDAALTAGVVMVAIYAAGSASCPPARGCIDEAGGVGFFGWMLIAAGIGMNLLALPAVIVGIRQRVQQQLALYF
jgi:hypothetical protein